MNKVSDLATAYASAQSLLDRLGTGFDATVAQVAGLCARDGKLDAARLDQHQSVCYDLALANAELLAARTLASVGAGAMYLDAGLGLAFITDAIVVVLGRLDGIAIATGIANEDLRELANGTELRRLRYDAARPDVLATLGAAIASTNGEFAEVAVDEQTALARDAFGASRLMWWRPSPRRFTART